MHAEQKLEMRILTAARAAIDANHAVANELPDPERERRVSEYARQVAASGRITEWLPPAEPKARRYSRFDLGDILRPHQV